MPPVPPAGPEPDLLETATFDPKLRLYLFLKALLILGVTGVGLVLLPLSLWAAWWWSGRFFATLHCRLTRRRLYFSHGVLFQRERTIPLDKIQDLSLVRGPLLNALGLCALRIETAGASATPGNSAADLVGLVGPRSSRNGSWPSATSRSGPRCSSPLDRAIRPRRRPERCRC